jgi:hypothetical protein
MSEPRPKTPRFQVTGGAHPDDDGKQVFSFTVCKDPIVFKLDDLTHEEFNYISEFFTLMLDSSSKNRTVTLSKDDWDFLDDLLSQERAWFDVYPKECKRISNAIKNVLK